PAHLPRRPRPARARARGRLLRRLAPDRRARRRPRGGDDGARAAGAREGQGPGQHLGVRLRRAAGRGGARAPPRPRGRARHLRAPLGGGRHAAPPPRPRRRARAPAGVAGAMDLRLAGRRALVTGVAEPEDTAALVALLSADLASWITGGCIDVDGGWVKSIV